jgi:photosystem II CP43 chlorophyll apoprotein
MTLYELSHYVPEKPFYEQGFILLPHLATLAFAAGPASDVASLYAFFVIAVLHLFSAALLALGGIYHSIFGPASLEQTPYGFLFGVQWQDRSRVSALLGVHLLMLSFFCFALYLKACYFGGIYDPWCVGGGDIRVLKPSDLTYNPSVLLSYLISAPFGSSGSLIGINNMEDLVGAHYILSFYLLLGGLSHIQTRPFAYFVRSFAWTPEAYLSYSLSAVSLCGFISSVYAWYNNTAYPSEYFGPTGPEASQSQSFTFLLRDSKLGIDISTSQSTTSLGKYLMRSPTGEIIFGGETMRFWSLQAPWLESLRSSTGLDLSKLLLDIQTWQERRAAEFMTHAPLGSLNSVGGVATEINSVNYVSPRSWLTCSHWFLSFFLLVGHWWHGARVRISAVSGVTGLSRTFEPVLYMRPID